MHVDILIPLSSYGVRVALTMCSIYFMNTNFLFLTILFVIGNGHTAHRVGQLGLNSSKNRIAPSVDGKK